ncbi:MAG TPA: hypothetical protein VNJ08_13060 [Bacteriovoracaceae bacterium]|nr:hypothetical protein [Bacteriovoracaceae bacterium]
MKYIALLGLLISTTLFADFVYMQEDDQGKSIQWNNGTSTQALSDRTNSMWAIYPDISADGNEFVYVEGADQSDLHLVYINPKKNLKQIFNLPQKGMLLHPKFSKNGQYIFYSAPGPTGKNTVYYFDRAAIVAQQGPGLSHYSLRGAKALDDTDESYFPRPSADGNFVVYQRNVPGKKEIVLFDRMENKKRILVEGMSPALSADERVIAYTAKTDGNWNIHTVNRVTGQTEQVTSDSHDEMAPTFQPDGTLTFTSNKSGHYELFELRNKEWKLLVTNAKADFYSPHFSGETKYVQSEKAPFLGNPRSSFGTVSHEGKVYMAGGHQGAEHTYPPESFTDTFVVYDIANNTWAELAPRPFKTHGYQIAAYGNYIYAFGGFAYSEIHKPRWKSLDAIDRYDIKANKWETIGKLSEPRSSNVAVTINDKVYLAAGWNATPKFLNDANGKFHDTIEIFDLKTEKLEVAAFKIPSPVRRALTGIELNGEIVLVGGLGEGASHFELLNKVTSINPVDGTSRELTPLPFETFAPAAEVLGNELFVFGGMFKTGPMDYEYVAHIYGLNLESKEWRHTGRYMKETKGFSQVFKVDEKTLGILGGHHYEQGEDRPVKTFETFRNF